VRPAACAAAPEGFVQVRVPSHLFHGRKLHPVRGGGHEYAWRRCAVLAFELPGRGQWVLVFREHSGNWETGFPDRFNPSTVLEFIEPDCGRNKCWDMWRNAPRRFDEFASGPKERSKAPFGSIPREVRGGKQAVGLPTSSERQTPRSCSC